MLKFQVRTKIEKQHSLKELTNLGVSVQASNLNSVRDFIITTFISSRASLEAIHFLLPEPKGMNAYCRMSV